jgi:ADP-heptose:LPS heptosyltransferase
VALEFSQEPFFVANSIAARLTAPPSNPSAADAAIQTLRAQIMDWKAEGHCVIGIALGAGKELKKWPRHYFVELAKGLLELGGVRLLFIGGPGDREDAAVACAELGLDAETHAKCGAVPLAELGRVLQPLDLFIGNDTGTTHFAGRVGVRTIAIFSGCTHPREWGPIGDHVSWLYRDEDCAPCYLAEITECGYGHVCIRNLLPTGVAAIVIPEVLGVLSARQVGKGSSA